MAYEPYSAAESRQEKDRVVVELKHAKTVPPSFYANVAACDKFGRPLIDPAGSPVMERVSLARSGQFWEQMAITNYTDHVIRMNGVAIRLFDPGANQMEALSWEDLNAQLYAERPCSSSQVASQIFRVNKIFDRNMEIVPGTTSTFWVAFRPPSMAMAGVWKFAVYEVPVLADSAGRPVRTTQFEMRVVAKQFLDTYSQAGTFDKATLVQSAEVSPTVQSSAPAPARATQPAPSETKASGAPAGSAAASAAAPGQQPTGGEAPPGAPFAVTKETITRAQVQLKALGFDPGAADGGIGPRTREALRKFQAARGLPATGALDRETAKALGI